MASGTILFPKASTTGDAYILGKIDWESVADTETNSSAVTAKLYVRKDNKNHNLSVETRGPWRYEVSLDDYAVSSGSERAGVLMDWVLIHTLTATFVHDGNGEKT